MPAKRAVQLTIALLCAEARRFAVAESSHDEPSLYGVTDGKAVGTYLEHKFRAYLRGCGYRFAAGNSASGIDFPDIYVDMKVTSIRQPQSSCPYKSARQKIFGLGYSLLVFVYDKSDNAESRCASLKIAHAILVDKASSADYQITRGILEILARDGNHDDIVAFLAERHLPADEIELANIAAEILATPPCQGYLTISNALQWRLQYGRVIEKAGTVDGVLSVYDEAANEG